MPIIDIKFKNENETYTYTPYTAENVRMAVTLWKKYVNRHFKTKCRIVDIKVTKLRMEQ